MVDMVSSVKSLCTARACYNTFMFGLLNFKIKKEQIVFLAVVKRYVIRFKRDFIVLGILSLVGAITNSVVPYLAGRLIDNILNPDIFVVQVIIATWFLLRIVSDMVDRYIATTSDKLETFIQSDYMASGISKIFKLSVSFHKNKKMGEIADRLSRAAGRLGSIISRILISLAPDFLSIFIAIVISFSIKPILAALLLVAIAIYISILFKVTPGVSLLDRKMHRAYSEAYGNAYDSIYNVQTIKQSVAEDYEGRKQKSGFNKADSFWLALSEIWSKLSFYQRFIVSITQFSIYIISIYFIRAGVMTVGDLIIFNGYAAMIFGPFVRLGRDWQNVQNGVTSIARAESLLEFPEEIYEPDNATIIDKFKGDVLFKNVSFHYQKKSGKVLEDISFHATPGMTVALVGQSGVGKTTLTEMISFYLKPTAGKILIDGRNIKNLDLNTLRSNIAVVPQEVALFNDTVKNNIRYGHFGASDKEVINSAKLAHADVFIQKFPKKYRQVVGEHGIKLSTGQKQRIAIARAILRNPKILILDEPTSALDAVSEKLISESLESLMKGRTTFIIAHRLSTVRKADLILVFEAGKIVEKGTHEELLQIPNGVYKHLYELQIGLK